ncbi:MAG: primosomal protein N' [Nitrospinae bacterium RIFCSPLOWO2_12_39_16]|nr:MAG: primosomal protein N' [Nitrospinae bacterium RIFCSPLOWO2_12_39_16]
MESSNKPVVSGANLFAEVVFGIPVNKIFLYKIPDRLKPLCTKGIRVFAPFGRRNLIGYIVALQDKADIETKELIEILDDKPVVNEEMLKFTRWISDYYLCPWGEVIESAMPEWVDVKIVNKREIRRVKERSQKPEARSQKLEGKTSDFSLTTYQENVINKIKNKIDEGKHQVFLLHGVTGSGKTEVYIRATAEVLKKGEKVIVMVPEITLTLQLFQRFLKIFGNRLAILHSGLTQRERYNEWMKVRNGEVDIVIGARSAVFAPFENIGLIIVDEEHDTAYKQDTSPRYNGRDIAIVRGKSSEAVVILGSATPSMESFYNSQTGKYEYLHLPDRIDKKTLPLIEIVDIKGGNIISERLKSEIEKRIERKEQTLLFINRRGSATFIQCSDCGYVWRCKNCSVSLTHHKKDNLCVCHYCGYSETVSDTCPQCKGYTINYKGRGTQKIEDEIRALFPNSNIERMDRDTVRKKGEAGRILKGIDERSIDILIGTQMIAKGHDYPGITLVGIVSADESLNIPDFRASERTFQLITQVAGRAGRGDINGDVILQTYNPDHYSVKCAKEYDFIGFYNQEGELREALNYPPYSKMVSFKIEGSNEKVVEQFSHNLGKMLDEIIGENAPHTYSQRLPISIQDGSTPAGIGVGVVEKLGPSKAIIYKIRNRYRWQIILKGKKIGSLRKIVSRATEEAKTTLQKTSKGNIKLDIDIDPINLM